MCVSELISKSGLGHQDTIKISAHSRCLPFSLCSLHHIALHVVASSGSCRKKIPRVRWCNFALVMPTTYSCRPPMYRDCTGSQNVHALALPQLTWSSRAPFKHLNLQRWHSLCYYMLYWEKLGAERLSHLHNEIEIRSSKVPFEAQNIVFNLGVRGKHNQ